MCVGVGSDSHPSPSPDSSCSGGYKPVTFAPSCLVWGLQPQSRAADWVVASAKPNLAVETPFRPHLNVAKMASQSGDAIFATFKCGRNGISTHLNPTLVVCRGFGCHFWQLWQQPQGGYTGRNRQRHNTHKPCRSPTPGVACLPAQQFPGSPTVGSRNFHTPRHLHPNCKTQHRCPPPLQRARAGPWRYCPDGHDSAIGRPAASRRRRQQRRHSCSSSSDAERDCLAERLQLQPQLRPSSCGRRRSAAASAGLLWCPSGRTNPFILGPHGATARTFS